MFLLPLLGRKKKVEGPFIMEKPLAAIRYGSAISEVVWKYWIGKNRIDCLGKLTIQHLAKTSIKF